MSPVGSFSSNKNFKLNFLFASWVETHPELGYGFDSSAGFTLPDLSMRSPDAAWIRKERWDNLSTKEQKVFAPICPDFVIELRSESDSINALKEKMIEWVKNGCRLGWLIDPIQQKSYIYESEGSIFEIDGFDKKLSGESLLPGFELDLSRLK
jgi:Uma2 family endonuclease